MKVFTARQAIFNSKKQVVAYELFFRDGMENSFPNVGGTEATAKLILDTQFNVGLEQISSGKPALINFTQHALLDKIPTLLPAKKVIIEILEDVEPAMNVYTACKEMFLQGYRFALDDYQHEKSWVPFIKLSKIIKIDINLTPLDTIVPLVKKLKELKNIKLLAEKVETYDELIKAKKMGFSFFQGYFFCKPEILAFEDVDIKKEIVVRLYQETLKELIEFEEVARLIAHDTALSYKLFRFINSGLFELEEPLTNIRQAVTFIGEKQVRKFIWLVATAHISENKPSELTSMSIIRARFCEQLALKVSPKKADNAFLTGLFSLLDAILDKDFFSIIESMPLHEDVASALLGRGNALQDILETVKAYETGSWSKMRRACAKLRMEQEELPDFYFQAVEWANVYDQAKS